MEALKVSEHVDNWNDDRIGELARDVKAGFTRVEGQIKEVEGRSAARSDRLEDRLEKLQHWIWGIGATLVVSVIAGVVARFA